MPFEASGQGISFKSAFWKPKTWWWLADSFRNLEENPPYSYLPIDDDYMSSLRAELNVVTDIAIAEIPGVVQKVANRYGIMNAVEIGILSYSSENIEHKLHVYRNRNNVLSPFVFSRYFRTSITSCHWPRPS